MTICQSSTAYATSMIRGETLDRFPTRNKDISTIEISGDGAVRLTHGVPFPFQTSGKTRQDTKVLSGATWKKA